MSAEGSTPALAPGTGYVSALAIKQSGVTDAAIRLVDRMGTMYRGHFALEVTSRLAAASGDWPHAARFQGASDAVVDSMGGQRTWFDDPVLRALNDEVALKLGRDAYAAAYGDGRALSMAAALSEAASWLASSSAA